MKSTKVFILIANSEWALWVQLEDKQFKIIEEKEHPESKEKVNHLVSDRSGRTSSRMSMVRHALNEGKDVLKTEREKFAREIVLSCQHYYLLHLFQHLWVVSGPKFLGELRLQFGHVSHLPYTIREIPKELSHAESLEDKMGKIQKWVYGKKDLWKKAS